MGFLVPGPLRVRACVRVRGEDNGNREGTAEPSQLMFPREENQN